MSERREYRQYRIESRKPGERRWAFRAFSGAWASADLEKVKQTLERERLRAKRADSSSRGYTFRIVTRYVVEETTDWELLAESQPTDNPSQTESTG